MSIYNSIYVLLLLCLSVVFKTYAQEDIYELQSINVKEGLPNSNTHDILQDKNNFIWISSPGSLIRYDGYNFKNYDASFFNINESATLSIALDQNNLIWFCERLAYFDTPKSGVFNTETDSIIKFEDFSKGLFRSEDIIYLNASDKEKDVIFISTRQGIVYKYDGVFKKIATLPILPQRIVSCDSDAEGNYWIGFNNNEIVKVNSKQEIIDSFKIDKINYTIKKIIATTPFVILEVYDSKYNKLYSQIKNNELEALEISENDNIKLLTVNESEMFFLKNDTIYKGALDQFLKRKGNVAIASITNLQHNASFIDKQGILWISSRNGLYKIISKKNPFNNMQQNNSIRGIYAENTTLWIGGYSQNVTYNLVSQEVQEIEIPKPAVTSFMRDKNDNLWVGTSVNWLHKFDATKKTWKSIKNSSVAASLITFLNPITNKIWVGTSSGLSYLDKNENLIKYNLNETINGAQIRQFLYTSDGIWIASNRGLFLMDAKTETISKHYSETDGLPTDNINHIYKDREGIFWLATKTEGLIKWNFESNNFKQFTRQNGLSNNTIYAVYEDDYQNLWLPSNYGLMRFDKVTNDIQVFTVDDGITDNEFNTFAHFKDADGTLYFGGISGLTSFHPKDFIDKKSEENPIYLSDIKVLKKNAKEFESLSIKPNTENPINLNYDDQILQFEVSLLDFKYVGNHQYAYKIEGYHNQWIYTRDHKISIFNFPYGNHTILVKAKGDSDLWTTNELQIPITVNKPFYLQWQYIALAFLTSMVLVYFYTKQRIKTLNKAKLKLESEVKSRTQQIETDKKIIEVQAEELKVLDVAKGRFFANLTHEFRTPLTLIIGPLEQIIDSPPPAAILKRRATGILNNAKHILGLINQLLDLTKLESKQMPIEVVNDDIIDHTKELVKRFQPLTLQNQQQLTFNSIETEWLTNFDSDKWDKIVYNLVSNAIKFTPKEGKIDVVLNRFIKEGETCIELLVKDSGIGIDEKNKSAIFNRFHQVDLSSKRANDGTGIGLALVRELVDLQQGNISIDSKINEGSTFRVVLPVQKNAVTKPYIPNLQNEYLIPIVKSSEDVSTIEADNNEKLDILVVEDNEDIRDYIVQCLGEKHYSISTAKDGEEGLQKALSFIPDLIISDVMMPKKNGFELVEDIRNQISTSHIPIILLTAKTTLDSKLQGLKHGADAYLTKPFNPKELDVHIKNLIEMRQRLQNRYSQNQTNTNDSTFEKEDTFIIQLKKYITDNLNKAELNGDTIGLHFGLSRIHLYRKIKALTNASISEFVKDIRLEKGLELIAQKQLNISEIAYEIGFTSPSHFSRSFKEKYGKSPSQM